MTALTDITSIEFKIGNSATTPVIDLHSSGQANDYDVRLICSGGGATAGQGTLTILAGSLLGVTPPVYDASTKLATTAWVLTSINTRMITSTYTASGAIAPGDSFAIVIANTTAAMTLANSTVDGHQIVIKRYGTGSVTVTGYIDGIGQSINMTDTIIRECLQLCWSNALVSYLLI